LSRVIVRIPYALQPFTKGAAEITVEALNLRHALSVIDRSHPGLCARVLTPEGDIRPNVNLFVGDTSARNLDGLNTSLDDGAVVSIIPAVAGGS
jgi:molybdopterin converting factor small subunit